MSHALTKRELREQRRAERQAAEQAIAARATRRRRLYQLAATLGLAAVVVGVAIAVSSGGNGGTTRSPSQAAALFAGIPEHNGVLGDPNAPVTVTEFVDLQCPICAEASRTLLPSLVRDYVKTGKVKLQARTLQFIGADSVRAARVAAGAERQGRLWPFLEAFYAAQKTENSGYVTDGFLRSVASAAGVNAGAALAYADGAAAQQPLATANAEASRLGVTGTPTFTVARGHGAPKVVSAQDLGSALAVASRQ
jgi:protein-disulfide isomerase